MTKKKSILFVGALWQGSTALQRMHALIDLGYDVISLDYSTSKVLKNEYHFIYRVIGKLYRMGVHNFRTPDLAGINNQIIACVKINQFDFVFFDKCMTVDTKTFKFIKMSQPQCTIIGYSPDDMFARHNQSRQFLDTIPLYDIFFTTKSYGVKELQLLGCKNVHFIGNAYDHNIHKPVVVTEADLKQLGGPVGFIGSWETDRAQSMYYLAKSGIIVRVWGDGWERCKHKHNNLILENKSIWATDYAKGISTFDINLCFLRKINRDLQTTRSVEIPACAGFMLAERTSEHLELFKEGIEAEFFSSDDELLQKVRYYLDNPSKRKQIAEAGRERCLKSGYSYVERMIQMLNLIDTRKVQHNDQ